MQNELSRRDYLKALGATGASAGLAGCFSWFPYEEDVEGCNLNYSTVGEGAPVEKGEDAVAGIRVYKDEDELLEEPQEYRVRISLDDEVAETYEILEPDEEEEIHSATKTMEDQPIDVDIELELIDGPCGDQTYHEKMRFQPKQGQ